MLTLSRKIKIKEGSSKATLLRKSFQEVEADADELKANIIKAKAKINDLVETFEQSNVNADTLLLNYSSKDGILAFTYDNSKMQEGVAAHKDYGKGDSSTMNIFEVNPIAKVITTVDEAIEYSLQLGDKKPSSEKKESKIDLYSGAPFPDGSRSCFLVFSLDGDIIATVEQRYDEQKVSPVDIHADAMDKFMNAINAEKP